MASIFRQGAVVIGLIPVLAAAQQTAPTWQNLDRLDAAVAEALGADGTARPVDRRLKLKACPEPVAVDAPILGAAAVRCASAGWRLRVPLLANAGPGAAQPVVIHRGDPVSVVTSAAGFSVTADGIAEGDGRIGDRLRVRIRADNPAISGEIVDSGTVRIR